MIFTEPKLLTAERFVDKEACCSYRYVLSTTEYFRPHYHDYYELFVMLDGTALHCVNGGEYELTKGDTVFIRPSDIHDYICENGVAFSMMNITFTADTADAMFDFLGEGFPSKALKDSQMPPTRHLSERELERFKSRMDYICSIDEERKPELKTAIRTLLFNMFSDFFSGNTAESQNMPIWLERLLSKMQQNGNYIYGTERMLKLSSKTREHTLRSIKKYTGMTATEYINGLRLNYIANMLRNSNHSVSDIIFESGFNNISWANEKFKERYGMTMTAYRKQSF